MSLYPATGPINRMAAAVPRHPSKSQDKCLTFDTGKPFCVPHRGAQNGVWDLSAHCAADPSRSKLYVWNEFFYMLFTTFSSTSEIFGLRTETSAAR